MAAPFTSPVGATQVGPFFVQQYYHILQQQPDYTHRFYTDASSAIRVDGDASESASSLLQIHELTVSLNFAAIEIKTINSLESWNGGIIVVVSGNVKSKGSTSDWRKFVQTFFLAPQEKGYFVLNDIFHYVSEEALNQPQPPTVGASEVIHQSPAPVVENEFESEQSSSIPSQEQPVSDYALEAEAREYGNSVHLEGIDPVEDYSFEEHEPEQNHEPETVEEVAPLDVSSAFQQDDDDSAQGSLPAVEEPVGDTSKISYASILRATKGNSASTASIQPSFNKVSQPALQQSNPAMPVVSNSPEDAVEESQLHRDGESKSIYVRNLPPGVSTLEVLEEFKNFGRVKQDGVFVSNRPETGVCFAFIEFDDVESAQKAVKASPMKFAGRQVYVEFKRPSISGASRGGRTGRGRWWRAGAANNYSQGKQSGRY